MSNLLTTTEVFQLNSVQGGLRPGAVGFKTVSLCGDRYVCVRDVQPDGQASLAVADVQAGTSERHNIKDSDAALLHPSNTVNLLALRSGAVVQIFDLKHKRRVQYCTLVEPVAFWCWADDRTLALVTNSSVHHWDVPNAAGGSVPEGTEGPAPTKVFDRDVQLDASVQILSYCCDKAKQWHLLSGVARNPTTGALAGRTQLFSVANGATKMLDGHAGCFAQLPVPVQPGAAADPRQCLVMFLTWHDAAQGGQLLMLELPSAAKPDASYERRQVSLPMLPAAPAAGGAPDFPVVCHVSPRHRLLMVVTSRGQAAMLDIVTGNFVTSPQGERVTPHVVFCASPWSQTGGLLCVNNQGGVFHVSPNDTALMRHLGQTSPELALRVASSAGLPGADDLFRARFEQAFRDGDVAGAIDAARRAPRGILRNASTIARLGQMAVAPGQSPPMSLYFKTMLANNDDGTPGTLNESESIELAKALLPKGGIAFVQEQFNDNKLTVTEGFGDAVAAAGIAGAEGAADLALKVYFKAGAHAKVVNALLQRNETEKAVEYCQRVNYQPEWRLVLTNLVRTNPTDAVGLAVMLHNTPSLHPAGSQPLDPCEVVELFLPGQHIRPASEYLLKLVSAAPDGTSRNGPETAALQTKLLEINLKYSPPDVSSRIFQQNLCPHYDARTIAPLCERANLFQYALDAYRRAQAEDNYETPGAVGNMRRCLAHAPSMDPTWLLDFFGRLRQQDSLELLGALLEEKQANFKLLVQIATKYAEGLGTQQLVDLFLEARAFEVLYYFLGAVVPYSRDADVHFRYIEAACEVGQSAEVERMTRESPCYDPVRVKAYLKEKALDDQWPFINVCDKHEMIPEMVKYLLDTDRANFIEQFVQRRNPLQTPRVIAALLEYDASEKLIRQVLDAAGAVCPIDELVDVAEQRGRLKLLRPFLEARAADRRTDTALHTALAKIHVDAHDRPEVFLQQNEYYDARIVGQYCESRDPTLSFAAYSKGGCDEEMLRVGVANGMWRPLARHLVTKQDMALWSMVLTPEEGSGVPADFDVAALVEAVRHDALANTTVPEEVIVTVRAFMAAGRTHELTAILDQVVLHGPFQRNKYLENLLLISAIKAKPEQALEYVHKLTAYDPAEVGTVAVKEEQLEVAFSVYDKASMKVEAATVLLENMKDFSRARTFASTVNDDKVWAVYGAALLERGELHDAIDAFISGKACGHVDAVIAAANAANEFGDLIRYLTMVREEAKGGSKDPQVDTYLVLTYAKTGRLAELEQFLKNSTHSVRVLDVADRCFADGLYDPARVLYTAAANYPKLASTLLRLNRHQGAVEAATKAQNVKTWKEVHAACLIGGETEYAHTAAVSVAAHPDELEALVGLYEAAGLVDAGIAVLAAAAQQPSAPMSVFTELGLMYAKHRPTKLLEHVQRFPKKINTHRMIGACRQYHHYPVLRVLHTNNEDWLAAANLMMEHPALTWSHDSFKEALLKLGAADACYTALGFYLRYHPDLVHDLLTALANVVDAERVLSEIRRANAPVALVQSYLEGAIERGRNSRKVQEALHALYIEAEDFDALRRSTLDAPVASSSNDGSNAGSSHGMADTEALAAQLEKHGRLEFRRIALALHCRDRRFSHAIDVATRDGLFADAIAAAAEARDPALAEKLLRFFASEAQPRRPDCFAATLLQCYDALSPASVQELAWVFGLRGAAQPFLIQSHEEQHLRVVNLEKTLAAAKKEAHEASQRQVPAGGSAPLLLTQQAPPMGGMPPSF